MTQLQILEYALVGLVEKRKKAKTPEEKILHTKHLTVIVRKMEGEKRLIKIAKERGIRLG